MLWDTKGKKNLLDLLAITNVLYSRKSEIIKCMNNAFLHDFGPYCGKILLFNISDKNDGIP